MPKWHSIWHVLVVFFQEKKALNQLGQKHLFEKGAIDERKTLQSKKMLMNFIKFVLLDSK